MGRLGYQLMGLSDVEQVNSCATLKLRLYSDLCALTSHYPGSTGDCVRSHDSGHKMKSALALA